MTDELTALCGTAAHALVSAASSASLWAEVEPWISAEQQDEPRSAGLIQFQDELTWTVKVLGEATGCLNHRAKSYLVQRWEDQLLQLLTATPEIAEDLRGIVAVVQQGTHKSPLTHRTDDFVLTKRRSPDGILQIGVGRVSDRTASARYGEEQPSPVDRSVAPANVLSSNMYMEFAGDRTEALQGQATLGLRPIIWQPSALAGLVEPPIELLPAKLYGRLELLGNLDRLLSQPDRKLHVLAGEPGVGKRVLALTLAERARKRGIRVWWVHGAAESIELCMIAVAIQLGAGTAELRAARAGRRNLADLVWSHLERAVVPWMLVFDEVDAHCDSRRSQSPPLDQSDWVRPSNAGLVFMISRHVNAALNDRHRAVHPVDPLGPDDAMRLLRSRAANGGGDEKATQLTQYLENNPLTVELTAKYLSSGISSTRSFAEYLGELRNTARESQVGGETQHRGQLASIIRLIFSRLDHDGMTEVSALLILISHFAPGIPVPCSMLDVGPLVEYGVLPAVPRRENSKRIHRAIRILRSSGLVSVRPRPNSCTDFGGAASIRVHPLIAAACLDVLEDRSAAVADVARLSAAVVLHRAVQEQLGSGDFDWGEWFLLSSHVKALIVSLPRHSPVAAIEEAVTAARQTVERLARTGAHKSAEKLGRDALSLASNLPAENSALLQMSVSFARILIVRGGLGEAQELLQRVLEVRQRSCGLDYPATLDTLELIALLLHSQGELSQAKQMLSQVIHGRERRPGGEASDGMRTLSSLARILREQGRLAETERIARQVLATRQRLHGADAPDSLDAEVDYSVALRDLGRLHEAEAMQRTVLEARERVLGKDHPDTIGSWAALAETLRDLGRLHEAEAMQRTVLEARERVLGSDHPETLNSSLGLAVILRDTGRLEESEDLLRRLIDFYEQIGRSSSILLSARHNLAIVLHDRGHLDDAELIFRGVLGERQWSFGPNHPETLRTLSSLGSLLHIQGSLTEAEHMLREVEAAYCDMLGERHPRTLTARNNLANALFDSRSSVDAEEIYRTVLATQLEALGPSHPETLTTCQNLAAALSSGGSHEAARQVLSDVIAEYENMFKPDHPSLLRARYMLAAVQERQGYLDGALHSYVDVLHLQTAALGTAHPDTLSTRLSVSNVLLKLRYSSESRAEYERAILLAARATFPPVRR